MNQFSTIIQYLPYKDLFCFVDEITHLDESRAEGLYRIKNDEYFFRGHFPGNPIVPGVILSEIMAQIGLACFGLYLTPEKERSRVFPVFTNMEMDFHSQATPGELLRVESRKIYFRYNKLKCKVECKKEDGTMVSKGNLAGIISKQ